MKTIGEKMKIIRNSRGKSQQDIADSMGVSRAYYAQWENNARKINGEQLINFAKLMRVSMNVFNDTGEEDTLFSVMTQLGLFFDAEGIPESDKDAAYQDIMKLYLKSKESKQGE